MTLSPDRLHRALDATWPPSSQRRCGSFLFRDGSGGGKRVSAATLEGPFSKDALDRVEAELCSRVALFMIRAGDNELDAILAARGYARIDLTIFYTAEIETLAEEPRPSSLFECWPPLALQKQIWRDAGIGPERLAVMARASEPRSSFIARFQNRAAGVGFCALDREVAMLHALEIEPTFRRQGVARYMVRGIASWARKQGAEWFALAVTERNLAARGLYTALGMVEAGRYHYRRAPEEAP